MSWSSIWINRESITYKYLVDNGKEGSKQVEISGIDDNRQITAVFGDTMAGYFLPPQLIYKGKTPKSLPSVEFPADWHITFTENHWLNDKAMADYLGKVLFTYVEKKREVLKLDTNYPALFLFVRFLAQCTERIFQCLKPNVCVTIVPTNCTD